MDFAAWSEGLSEAGHAAVAGLRALRHLVEHDPTQPKGKTPVVRYAADVDPVAYLDGLRAGAPAPKSKKKAKD